MGRYGWQVDVVPASAQTPLILTATKDEVTVTKVRSAIVDAALALYADARRLDQLKRLELH